MKIFGALDIGDALLLSPRFAMDAAFRVRIAWGTIEVESSAFFTNPRRVVRFFLCDPTNIVLSDFSIAVAPEDVSRNKIAMAKKSRAKTLGRKGKRNLEPSKCAAATFFFLANIAQNIKSAKPGWGMVLNSAFGCRMVPGRLRQIVGTGLLPS